ncbi:TIGR03936 family radical SAM-associated protein [Hathewaya massiliensis]|uniref:TIGR03936 family radical SAM-associated protein n=1 Tax=Hathewaya massiliensis TaxID=1964382 RepID=UPI001158AF87|nr:TIGR03936 family radical SAM-associated protein [Hathewaya massiliensis]
MRYLIKYGKNSEVKFISHLDLMRTIQRTIRRAEIDVEFSKGFNPHMSLSIAQPLAVGVYSKGEYLDLVLLSEENEDELIKKLNKNAPRGIEFLEALNIGDKKLPQSMAVVEGALYVLKFNLKNNNKVEEEFNDLLKEDKWEVLKKGKKGERIIDLKSLIKDMKFWEKEGEFILRILVSCGSRENLSPQILADFLKEKCGSIDKDKFVDIRREEMFSIQNDKYISLLDYYKDAK